jgi:hypothetical protein
MSLSRAEANVLTGTDDHEERHSHSSRQGSSKQPLYGLPRQANLSRRFFARSLKEISLKFQCHGGIAVQINVSNLCSFNELRFHTPAPLQFLYRHAVPWTSA